MAPKILIVDLESTRDLVDSKIIRPTDLGAVLVSVEHRSIIQACSTLIPIQAPRMRQRRSRINVALTRQVERTDLAIAMFCAMAEEADYLVSHGKFDSQFFAGDPNHHPLPLVERLWIDSLSVDWGIGRGAALKVQCRHHGITNICPHRALADAMALSQCLCAGSNLEALLESGIRYISKALLPSSAPRKP